MTPVIDLYYFPPSPPCRAVMLTANVVGVKMNLKSINILEGEHMDPQFMKLNPQHTIPTMNDNGLVAWESRPIMCYLVDMYGNDESLYPKDPTKRIMVDQRLYFDMGTLYQRLLEYIAPVMFGGAAPDEQKKSRFEEALQLLNKFLGPQDWVAGDTMTIADISIIVTISTAEAVGFDISRYDDINAWYGRTKKVLKDYDYEETNQAGANMFGGVFRSKLR